MVMKDAPLRSSREHFRLVYEAVPQEIALVIAARTHKTPDLESDEMQPSFPGRILVTSHACSAHQDLGDMYGSKPSI